MLAGGRLDGAAESRARAAGARRAARPRARARLRARAPSNWRAYSSSARVAALAHGLQDRPHHASASRQPRRPARQQGARLPVLDARIRITARSCSAGTRRCPRAPASFSRGMMSRTVDSSRMVFTASHSSSLRCEMVGRFSAGSTASTAARLSLWTLSISPTLPSALMAPSSSMLHVFELAPLPLVLPGLAGWRSTGCSTRAPCR